MYDCRNLILGAKNKFVLITKVDVKFNFLVRHDGYMKGKF